MVIPRLYKLYIRLYLGYVGLDLGYISDIAHYTWGYIWKLYVQLCMAIMKLCKLILGYVYVV